MNHYQFIYAIEMRDQGLDYASKAQTKQEQKNESGVQVGATSAHQRGADDAETLAQE